MFIIPHIDIYIIILTSFLQNKTCVQTLEGHAQNISAVAFHPELPIIMTGSEDGKIPLSAGTQYTKSVW